MGRSVTPVRAMLDAWREQGADRLNPMRFHFIEALERRAANHDGEARRVLDERLSALIEAYTATLEKLASHGNDAIGATTPARSALGELVDEMARRAATRGDDLTADDEASRPSPLPELEVLEDFRKIWSRVRTESQLRQSLEQVPENAGPLNSGSLVHRSLTLMLELSPGYLQHFMAYVDALSWVEHMDDGGALAIKDAPRAASTKKRARSKPRERRD